jgi:hypothetical protein
MADCVAKVVGIRRIAKNGQPDLEKMFFAPGPKIFCNTIDQQETSRREETM